MPIVITAFEIPDPSRPLRGEDRPGWAASAELVPFRPSRLDPELVRGRTVTAVSNQVGTYGMGGPGFFGLQLGDEWLVVSIWGAASWMHCEDRLVEDLFYDACDRERPWITSDADALSPRVVGATISSISVAQRSLALVFSNGTKIEIRESPAERPVLEGSKEPRAFAADDDLRDGVFMAPTAEIWI